MTIDTRTAAVAGLLLALALANLPFLTQRLFGFVALARKSHGARLLEWLALYAVWMALGTVLESQLHVPRPKTWQVWFISVFFFAVLAFPGITWRYLWRRK